MTPDRSACTWYPLDPKHQENLRPYYDALHDPLADLNWEMMLSWRHCLDFRWMIRRNTLLMSAAYEGRRMHWGPPLGPGLTLESLEDLLHEAESEDVASEILYLWEGYPLYQDMLKSSRFHITPQAREYRYCVETLAGMEGGALKKKRYQARHLERKHQPETSMYQPGHRLACLDLLDRWLEEKRARVAVECGEKMEMEARVCRAALEEGISLTGVVVCIHQRLEAFSLGSEMPDGVFNCMFEKTNHAYPGLSVYVFRQLAQFLRGRFHEINAGEDWGVDYLRETKRSWHPSRTVNSYKAQLVK